PSGGSRLSRGSSVPGSWGTGLGVTSGQSSCALGEARVRTGAMSGAVASRPVSGGPSGQRSRRVRIRDVLRYPLVTTVRGSMYADTARVGVRIPARADREPNWAGGAVGSGGSTRRGAVGGVVPPG